MTDRPRKAAARGDPKRLAKGVTVTVMIDRYFGIHQHVIRSGLLNKLRPSAVLLYLYVLERSEFFCSREIRLLDTDIRVAINVARRTLVRDRQELNEHGLVQCISPAIGEKYTYTLCDPLTKKPYPGDPKVSIKYVKRGASKPEQPEPEPEGNVMKQSASQEQPEPALEASTNCPVHGWENPCPQCGIKGPESPQEIRKQPELVRKPKDMDEHGLPLEFK
ncbi:MAG TPA: hypothetical protein VFC29_09190 [Candidatus Limnocylindrales bacterium]|nr:hypothetical protein [Candidatus Limnocylindrales bacterium]